MRLAIFLALVAACPAMAGEESYFVPAHRVSGIGLDRDDLSDEVIELRTQRMIQSQTFGIMREAGAVAGAQRITGSPQLQRLFEQAAAKSGMPQTLIEAIAYLESWGVPDAESPAACKGIMQISLATAHDMGLKVVEATRYDTSKQKVLVSRPGAKPRYKSVTRRVPYRVVVRDERLIPERAIPAAAVYLATLERRYGSRDWAIFAYHCGQGCVAEMMDLTRQARGIPADQLTVPRMFFSANPVWNRELYMAITQQMQRDYSPTYYFRIMRAEELLALYRRDPQSFAALSDEYRAGYPAATRAPHRLALWVKHEDLVYQSSEDIRADGGQRLVHVIDRPDYLGYTLRLSPDSPSDLEWFSQATPSAVGALSYIAFETRRLYDEMRPHTQPFRPLEVTALVEPEDYARQLGGREALSHGSGQVFDIDYSSLPPSELECLQFVLDDLGWDGYLGFYEESRDSMHIGCAPETREFFAAVFQESMGPKPTE